MNPLNQKVIELIENSVKEYIQKVSKKYKIDEADLFKIWNNVKVEEGKVVEKVVEDKKIVQKKVVVEEKDVEEDSTSETGSENVISELSKASGEGCPYVFSKGTQSGNICGCKPKNGAVYCSKHKKFEGETKAKSPKKLLPNAKKSVVPTQPKKIVPVKPTSVVLHMNKKLDKLWHSQSGMVFKSMQDRVVIGKNVDGKIKDLTEEDIEICKSLNFRYEINDVNNEVKILPKIQALIKAKAQEKAQFPEEPNIIKASEVSKLKKSIHKAITDTNFQADDIEELLSKLQISPDDESDDDDISELEDELVEGDLVEQVDEDDIEEEEDVIVEDVDEDDELEEEY
jgi:hypothetical protein